MVFVRKNESVIAWIKVFLMFPAAWGVKFLGLFVVPWLDDHDRVYHSWFGANDATDLSWWNIAVRNAAHNFWNLAQVPYETKSNSLDTTLERVPGFQWRYRQSLDGKYVSLRVTWGKVRPKKGKKEFYIGWTLNETDWMRYTFFQLRMTWEWLLVAAAVAVFILI